MFFFFLQETKCPKIVSDFWAHFLRCVLSPHQFPAHRFSHKIKTDDLHHNRDDPRCRIRNKQEVQRFVMWEKSKNPENSRSDRTDHRQDHRHCRMSHPPQCSGKQIHNATQKIRHCCNGKNLHATLDHILSLVYILSTCGPKSHAPHPSSRGTLTVRIRQSISTRSIRLYFPTP